MSSRLPNPRFYLTESFWELSSVISVEEVPNRNCFGINSVILVCVCVMVQLGGSQGLNSYNLGLSANPDRKSKEDPEGPGIEKIHSRSNA